MGRVFEDVVSKNGNTDIRDSSGKEIRIIGPYVCYSVAPVRIQLLNN